MQNFIVKFDIEYEILANSYSEAKEIACEKIGLADPLDLFTDIILKEKS
jgi:hypothetical protein